MDAAQVGDTVQIRPGTYQEQLSPAANQEQLSPAANNDFAGADEPDRTVIDADPGASTGSVTFRSTFTMRTPDDSAMAEVVLLCSAAVTDGSEMAQRFI